MSGSNQRPSSGSGSGKSSSSSPWTWVVAGTAAAGLAAALWYLLSPSAEKEKRAGPAGRRAEADRKEQGGEQPQQPAAAGEEEEEEEEEEEVPEVSDAKLREMAAESLERVQTGEIDGPNEQLLLRLVQTADPSRYEPSTRIQVAQWLIMFHTLRQMMAQSQEEYVAAAADMESDMGAAWSWLDVDTDDAAQEAAANMLKMDVGQRLKSIDMLEPVFEKVMSKGDAMADEELLVCFTSAPLLGRWGDVRSLGRRILEHEHLAPTMEEFHRAALQRPDIPDYTVLYEMAEEQARRVGNTPRAQVRWAEYAVRGLRIRMRDVQCDDEARRQEVRRAFAGEGWQDVPVGDQTRIQRFGAISMMLSLSSVPIPMVGPSTDDLIEVRGFAELSRAQDQAPSMKQVEAYRLERSQADPGKWTGRYELVQAPLPANNADPHNNAGVTVVFDMEMEIEELEEMGPAGSSLLDGMFTGMGEDGEEDEEDDDDGAAEEEDEDADGEEA